MDHRPRGSQHQTAQSGYEAKSVGFQQGRTARPPHPLAELQRRAGNRAVARMFLQRSLVWNDGKRTRALNQALPHVEPAKPHDFGTTFGIINEETFPVRGDPAMGVAAPKLSVGGNPTDR